MQKVVEVKMTPEKREEIMRELREIRDAANSKHGYVPDPDEEIKNLRAWQAKNGVVSDEPAERIMPVQIKYITDCTEMSESVQDFDFKGNLSKLKRRVSHDNK